MIEIVSVDGYCPYQSGDMVKKQAVIDGINKMFTGETLGPEELRVLSAIFNMLDRMPTGQYTRDCLSCDRANYCGVDIAYAKN